MQREESGVTAPQNADEFVEALLDLMKDRRYCFDPSHQTGDDLSERVKRGEPVPDLPSPGKVSMYP